jgi:hypothetical protein
MIEKPEDAKPHYRFLHPTHSAGQAPYFSAAECAEIAKAYADCLVDDQTGAYGAEKDLHAWQDLFEQWRSKPNES